jgi:lipopolysaccharide export LptBFGC system permease protein LptF
MSLFAPLFRDLDQEIAVLERRIQLRRSLIKAREAELHQRLLDAVTSPAALAGAAALGMLLGRRPRRSASGTAARKSLWASIGGFALALLQMRFGSPYQWIARALMGSGVRASKGGRDVSGRGRPPTDADRLDGE